MKHQIEHQDEHGGTAGRGFTLSRITGIVTAILAAAFVGFAPTGAGAAVSHGISTDEPDGSGDGTVAESTAPATPGFDASLAPFCDTSAAYLAYTVEVNGGQGDSPATSATLTFTHPTDHAQNWSTEIALGAGTTLWPGITVDATGEAITWPGWRWDVDSQSWVADPGANFGWTTAPGTAVEISVEALSTTLLVSYPSGGAECNVEPTITVVAESGAEAGTEAGTADNQVLESAAPATAVEAEASFAG